MTSALIGLGSNAPQRQEFLEAALRQLADIPAIESLRASSFHGTQAVGGPVQADYLNAAATFETSLSPQELLAVLHRIEANLGRERTIRWGPRTIDLDLLLFGRQEIQSPELIVPHPRMATRRFVLAPAVEIAADWIYPFNGWSLTQLRQHLDDSPRTIAVVGTPQYSELESIVAERASGWQCRNHWAEGDALRLVIATSPPGSVDSSLDEFDRRRHAATSPPVLWLPQTDFSWLIQEVLAALAAME